LPGARAGESNENQIPKTRAMTRKQQIGAWLLLTALLLLAVYRWMNLPQ